MKRCLLLCLLAGVVNAAAPEWVELGTVEGRSIKVALNKKKMTGKGKFTLPVCLDNDEGGRDCSIAKADCEPWTVDEVIGGPGSVAELILKAICPK